MWRLKLLGYDMLMSIREMFQRHLANKVNVFSFTYSATGLYPEEIELY
jgi:hypothetical protein